MLVTWLIDHLMCGIYVGLSKGQFFYVITLDQHVIHRRTRVINAKSQLLDPLSQQRITPRRIANGFTVQVEEKLGESYRKLNTGQLLGKKKNIYIYIYI